MTTIPSVDRPWQKFLETTGFMKKIPRVDRLYDQNSLSPQDFITKIPWVDRLYDNNSQRRQALTKIPWVDRLYDNNSLSRQALWQQFLESTGFMTTIPWVDRLYSNAPNASYLLRVDILLTCRKHLRDGTISLRSMGHKPKYIYV